MRRILTFALLATFVLGVTEAVSITTAGKAEAVSGLPWRSGAAVGGGGPQKSRAPRSAATHGNAHRRLRRLASLCQLPASPCHPRRLPCAAS